jgi:hypothetical protein
VIEDDILDVLEQVIKTRFPQLVITRQVRHGKSSIAVEDGGPIGVVLVNDSKVIIAGWGGLHSLYVELADPGMIEKIAQYFVGVLAPQQQPSTT